MSKQFTKEELAVMQAALEKHRARQAKASQPRPEGDGTTAWNVDGNTRVHVSGNARLIKVGTVPTVTKAGKNSRKAVYMVEVGGSLLQDSDSFGNCKPKNVKGFGPACSVAVRAMKKAGLSTEGERVQSPAAHRKQLDEAAKAAGFKSYNELRAIARGQKRASKERKAEAERVRAEVQKAA